MEFDPLRNDVNLLKREVLEQQKGYSELRKDMNDIREKTDSITATDLEILRNDVNLLKRDTLEYKKGSSEIKKDVNKLIEKTANLIKEDDFNAIRESQAEIQSRLSDVSKELQLLTGRFDENRYFMEKTLKDSTTEKDIMKAQIMSIEGQIKDIGYRLSAIENLLRQPKEPPKEQLKETEKKVEEPPKDKTKMYEAAYNAFEKKRYKEAREKFEAFIKEFPEDKLTDNAHFWIAETYYGEKDFEGAILAYETLLKKYPNSDKAPAALLKQGFSFIEIGDKKTGKVILEQLKERYPNSKETGVAKKKLEEIEKKTSKKKK